MLKSHFTSNRDYSQQSRVTTIKVLSRFTIFNIVEYTGEICTTPYSLGKLINLQPYALD